MKQTFKLFVAGVLLLLAAAVTLVTDNPATGLLAASAAGVGFQTVTGLSLFDMTGVAGCTALVGIKRQCNKLTIGGAKRLYIVLVEDLESEFLTYELAKTAGKYAAAIPLVDGKKFIEVEAWYDTTKFDTEMKTGAGFTQNVEFRLLGYNADIVKFASLLYETPVNLIVQGNDDQLYYVGQKYIPMMFEMKGVLPEKGTARKEATFTAKQDGMQVPIFPLDVTATFEVTPFV